MFWINKLVNFEHLSWKKNHVSFCKPSKCISKPTCILQFGKNSKSYIFSTTLFTHPFLCWSFLEKILWTKFKINKRYILLRIKHFEFLTLKNNKVSNFNLIAQPDQKLLGKEWCSVASSYRAAERRGQKWA